MSEIDNQSEIIKCYLTGQSIAKLGCVFGISEYRISKLLKSNGIAIRTDNGQKINLDENEINKLYESGLSTYEIAKLKSCSDETIRKLIVVMRPAERRNQLNDNSKAKLSLSCKKRWQDPQYRAKVKAGTNTPEYKKALSEAGKHNVQHLTDWAKSKQGRATLSTIAKKLWSNKEYYDQQSIYFQERGQILVRSIKSLVADPIRKQAWINKLRRISVDIRQNQPKLSHTQCQLYYILQQSGITFYEEGNNTKVGPFYIVDCIIPKQGQMKRDLIIEVQGEYWHSLSRVIVKDQQKKTYILNHTEYDLLYLNELDFSSWLEVKSKLAAYGIELSTIKCCVHDLEVERTDEQTAKMFYSIFHYTSSIRKGAKTFIAKLADTIIAAVSYTYPIRSQIASSRGLKLSEALEISRLARITNIECSNLISWLLGATIKLLPQSVKLLITYSDSTYGHSGGVYKACNFTNDGIVEPDYWYDSINGRYHKRTIWGKAKQFGLTEAEYAEQHNLRKQYGGPKTRWVRWL